MAPATRRGATRGVQQNESLGMSDVHVSVPSAETGEGTDNVMGAERT